MKPDTIILHHSLTKDSATASWGAIRHFHVDVNHWDDIGYHFGIENMRGQTEILAGRFPDKQGAHCRGHNSNSIGICFVGNFDVDSVPAKAWTAGIELCRFLVKQYGIAKIIGHGELNPHKSCPGKNFDVDRFRTEVLR